MEIGYGGGVNGERTVCEAESSTQHHVKQSHADGQDRTGDLWDMSPTL